MPDRRLRAVRLAKAMKRCGVHVDPEVAFGRPRVIGTGIPVDSLWQRFLGGDSIASIARDHELKPSQVENAIRFCGLFPLCDSDSFWSDPRTKDYRRYL